MPDGAEMCPDDEKGEGNTLCIAEPFEEVWAHFFLPAKNRVCSCCSAALYSIWDE